MTTKKRTRTRRAFGTIRKLPSGRYQAFYVDPHGARRVAPDTFDAKIDAEAWLVDRRREITGGMWQPPAPVVVPQTFAQFAEVWLRERKIQPRTREHYQALLTNQINPRFGSIRVGAIDPPSVREWHSQLSPDRPTLRAHSYSLLRAVLSTAVDDGILPANPCHIRGARASKRVHKVKAATLPELATLVAAMPKRYQAMPLMAAWCALRFGELAELRRKDIDLKAGVIHVQRGVVRVDGTTLIGTPKTESSIRSVSIPPHLIPVLRAHIDEHATWGKDGLLFPAKDGTSALAPSSLYKVFYPARAKAGRPDLRFHDLRHTGAVLAASTGATLAELMGRLGHSTPAAALRYQHVAEGRDSIIAKRLSDLAAL